MDELFHPRPEQWGLRGDPYAWDALRDQLTGHQIPNAADAVRDLLTVAFVKLAGVRLDDDRNPEAVYIEQFAHGGMSSGHLHLPTWRGRLVPLLMSRAGRLTVPARPAL